MVCMNLLAMPMLKNDRACFLSPISSKPLRSLKVTFERARIGISIVGSFARCAAEITRSASPINLFSTIPFFVDFVFAIVVLFFLPCQLSLATCSNCICIVRQGSSPLGESWNRSGLADAFFTSHCLCGMLPSRFCEGLLLFDVYFVWKVTYGHN